MGFRYFQELQEFKKQQLLVNAISWNILQYQNKIQIFYGILRLELQLSPFSRLIRAWELYHCSSKGCVQQFNWKQGTALH